MFLLSNMVGNRQFSVLSDNEVVKCQGHIEGILPKSPYLPCVSMAGRALLAGPHRCVSHHEDRKPVWVLG